MLDFIQSHVHGHLSAHSGQPPSGDAEVDGLCSALRSRLRHRGRVGDVKPHREHFLFTTSLRLKARKTN